MHFYFAFNQISYKKIFYTVFNCTYIIFSIICFADFKYEIIHHDFDETININHIIKRFIDMNICIIFLFFFNFKRAIIPK